MTQPKLDEFQKTIYHYYEQCGRRFSWRETTTPYHIFVSEVMLQQTQTTRVKGKYESFIEAFPSFEALANASLYEVLDAWKGLGYNRRAQNLHKSATIITNDYQGVLPRDTDSLQQLPGIGVATAASIAAFAFNQPTVFVETNIRVVFIYFFLSEKEEISDKELLTLVEQTLDTKNPREWYYALMDYGVMLKAQGINPINKSKHYKKQSKFEGSNRQIRGALIKLLLENKKALAKEQVLKYLQETFHSTAKRTTSIIDQLCKEKMIEQSKGMLSISLQEKTNPQKQSL